MRSIGVLVLLLVANTALAAPVRWKFHDVIFNDGTRLTGSFVFDIDAPAYNHPDGRVIDGYSNVNILTREMHLDLFSWQADYNAACLDQDCGYSSEDMLIARVDGDCGVETLICRRGLGIRFDRELNATGGYMSLSGQEFYEMRTATGWSNWGDRRIDSGYIYGTVVPIPAAAWLFGSGLLALGWVRRRG